MATDYTNCTKTVKILFKSMLMGFLWGKHQKKISGDIGSLRRNIKLNKNRAFHLISVNVHIHPSTHVYGQYLSKNYFLSSGDLESNIFIQIKFSHNLNAVSLLIRIIGRKVKALVQFRRFRQKCTFFHFDILQVR